MQFKLDNRLFITAWDNYLQKIKLPGKNIVVEITEGLLLNVECGVLDKRGGPV